MSRFVIALMALLAAAALDRGAGAATDDVKGWRQIVWGMPLAEALGLLGNARIVQRPKSEIAGCHFEYAVPIRFEEEEWDAWLCEDRADASIVAINIEKGYRGNFFFEQDQYGSRLLEQLFADLSAEFGGAHRHWQYCFNVLGNPTEQYQWYFPSTVITFLIRDAGANWAMIRFERASGRPEFGPGVCSAPPVDLR